MRQNSSIIKKLSKDPVMKRILKVDVPLKLAHIGNLSNFLYTSIINQQLSSKVGEVFHQRFLELFRGHEPTAEQVANMPVERLHAIGLSKSKSSYIKNVAVFDLENSLSEAHLEAMSDEEVIAYITKIKGIGEWTAQMLLMFGLGREDVFAGGDLGIQKSIADLYHLDREDKTIFKEKITKIAEMWRPFRSYACLALWSWNSSLPKLTKAVKAEKDQ